MNVTSEFRSLRKQYSALSRSERFAAIQAAALRGDNDEWQALMDSAPRLTARLPDHYGLSEAWEFLSSFYVMCQLADAAMFFMALHMDEKLANAEEGEAPFDAMKTLQDRILARAQAWREHAEENKLDPDRMLAEYPGGPILELIELLMTATNGGEPVDRADVDSILADYRGTLEHCRKQWE